MHPEIKRTSTIPEQFLILKKQIDIQQQELELIESFLGDKLSKEEKMTFEKSIKEDQLLAQKVADIKEILQGIEEGVLKNQLNSYHKEITPVSASKSENLHVIKLQKKSNNRVLLYLIAASLVVAFGLFFILNESGSTEKLYATYFDPDPGLPTTMGSSDNYPFFDAMVNYKQGDYKKAISKWEVLEKKAPENDTINYFLGVAYLADNNEVKAIPYLNKTINSSNSVFADDAYYYLGLAYIKSNKIEQAKQAFKKSSLKHSQEILNALK